LQGLKPIIDLMGFIGLTKVMPFLQSPGELPLQSTVNGTCSELH
jgi:hypothetical protein